MNIISIAAKYGKVPPEPARDVATYQEGYAQQLAIGEAWEELVALTLTDAGLTAYRPDQHFIRTSDLKRFRQKGCCHWMDHGDNQGEDYYTDLTLLRPYQRDILVKLDKVRRLSVEVKALCAAAFDYYQIHVGCCEKWDEKRFKVDILILVNQATGEAYAVEPMEGWLRAKLGTKLDYAVPRHLLSPLAAWVDAIKDSKTE